MTAAGRWSLVALVAVLALVVALWPRDAEAPMGPPTSPSATQWPERRADDTPQALAGPRAQAALRACPTGETPATNSPLGGVTLGCLSDGAPVPLSAALAGRPAVLNIWAYWCGPCAQELPALQEYAAQVEGVITVLTVHNDPNETNALLKLAEYGVTLPGVQDGSGRFAAAVGAPNVLPVTVVLHADGSVAEILPVPFTSAAQIAAAVDDALKEVG